MRFSLLALFGWTFLAAVLCALVAISHDWVNTAGIIGSVAFGLLCLFGAKWALQRL